VGVKKKRNVWQCRNKNKEDGVCMYKKKRKTDVDIMAGAMAKKYPKN